MSRDTAIERVSDAGGWIVDVIHRNSDAGMWIVRRGKRCLWFKTRVSRDWFNERQAAFAFARSLTPP